MFILMMLGRMLIGAGTGSSVSKYGYGILCLPHDVFGSFYDCGCSGVNVGIVQD